MPKGASFHCEINIKFWFGRLIKYDIYHIIIWRSCALDGLQCFPVGNILSKNNYHILFHLISTLLVMWNAHRWHSLAPNPLHAHICMHGQHTKILYSKKILLNQIHRVRQHCDHTQDLRIFCKENSRWCFNGFFYKGSCILSPIFRAVFWNFIVKFNRTLLEYFSIFRLKFNQLPNQTSNNCNLFATEFT